MWSKDADLFGINFVEHMHVQIGLLLSERASKSKMIFAF